VRGRRFPASQARLHLHGAEGFALDNTAHAMFGVKDNGSQALRLDVVRVSAEPSLLEYLNSGWVENIDPKSIEEIIVGGFPAAPATAQGDQWSFRLYVVRFGQRGPSHDLCGQAAARRSTGCSASRSARSGG
jgi:predicted Zn-dependent protease